MNEAQFLQQIREDRLAGAYLLFGDEPYSRGEALRAAKATVDADVRDLNVQLLRAPLASDVMNACETLPFFAEKRIVIVEEADADCREKLADYVERVPDACALLIVAASKPNVQSALWKAFQKLDRAVEFRAFDPKNGTDEARAFIEQCVARCGSTIEPGAARRMLEYVGYDQGTLETTAIRLCDYAGRGRCVTLADVTACIPPSTEYTVFQMLDRLVAGNRKGALLALTTLVRDGANTSMGLASFFSGQLKQMLIARQLLDAGKSDQAAAAALSGSPYAAKMAVQKAKKCTRAQIVSAMTAFSDVDWMQKSGVMAADDAMFLAMIRSFEKGEPNV